MKAVIVLLIIGIVWAQDHLRTCNITCVPDDEFENDETTTEWDEFMDTITRATFDTPYELQCVGNENETAYFDYHSDILWDLRFKIYSERQNVYEKTLNDCYCDFQDCKSEEFRNCLKNARIAMNNEVYPLISDILFKLSEEC